MNCWIFVANNWTDEGISAREVIIARAGDRFWGIPENARHAHSLQRGDLIVWYAAGRNNQILMGTATLAGPLRQVGPDERDPFAHGTQRFRAEQGADLQDVDLWETEKPFHRLVPRLRFITNPARWGQYLQGSIIRVSAEDYATMVD